MLVAANPRLTDTAVGNLGARPLCTVRNARPNTLPSSLSPKHLSGAAPYITYSSIGNLERTSFLLDLVSIAADAAADDHPVPEDEWDERTFSAPPPPDPEVVGKAIDDTLRVWRGPHDADDVQFVQDRGALYTDTVEALKSKGYTIADKAFGGADGDAKIDYAGLKEALVNLLPPVDYDFRQKITVMLADRKAEKGQATNLEITRDSASINTWNKQDAYERSGVEKSPAELNDAVEKLGDQKFNPRKPMDKQGKGFQEAKDECEFLCNECTCSGPSGGLVIAMPRRNARAFLHRCDTALTRLCNPRRLDHVSKAVQRIRRARH